MRAERAILVFVCGAVLVTGWWAGCAPPARAQPAPTSQPDLATRRLELDERQYQLARDRFEYEKAAAATGKVWYEQPLLGWIAGLVGVLLTWQLTRSNEREKHERQMVSSFDQQLRQQRTEAYRELWKRLLPLSLYGGGRFVRRDAARLRHDLRDWYFSHGMYLSEGTDRARERYFALQNALVLVSDHGRAGDELANESDQIDHRQAKSDEDGCSTFTKDAGSLPANVTESAFMQYRFLRALGSLLRTATVADMQSRLAMLDDPAEIAHRRRTSSAGSGSRSRATERSGDHPQVGP